ncbi:MAG: hypothetical protein ACE5D2_06025 [Fidelibacterota bacterium]
MNNRINTPFHFNNQTLTRIAAPLKFLLLFWLAFTGIEARDFASYPGGFLRMGTSARSIAMGSAFTAEIDQGFAAYHNPAAIGFLNQRRLGFAHHFLPLSRRFMATSLSTGLPPNAGVGIAWVSAGTDRIDGRTSSGEHTQYLSTAEDAIFFTFAQRLLPWFSIGINVKILNHQLPMNNSSLAGKGTGFDLGVFVRTKKGANLAFMIQDLNSSYQWNTGKVFEQGRVYVEHFPTIYRLGTTFRYEGVYITMDGGWISDNQKLLGYTLRMGGEYTFREHYFLRAGLGNQRMAVGLGLIWSFLKQNDARLDYAFVLETPAGVAHVFTYAFNF